MATFNKFGSNYIPHVLFGRVVAVDPYFNMVKVRMRPPYDCLPDQWARVIQPNSGSPLTPTSQAKDKISNESRTGLWILPNVNDFVICAYIEGTAAEPNMICLGAMLAPFEEKSTEANRFDDWALHHPSEVFLRLRGIDSVQKIIGTDSRAAESAFAHNLESSRSEIELNNKDGSIIRITQFLEGEILSDDEIYLRDSTEDNPQSPLKQGRRKRNIKQEESDVEILEKGRGMIQFLHNTGGYLSFRNLESSIEDDPRLKIELFNKNNIFKFEESILNKPEINLQHYTGSQIKFTHLETDTEDVSGNFKSNLILGVNPNSGNNLQDYLQFNESKLEKTEIKLQHFSGSHLTLSDNEAEGSSDIRSKIHLQHPVGTEFVIDEPTDGNTVISLTQSTSSGISFDTDGNVEIDTSLSDKKITIKAKNSTEITIEDGTIIINGDNVTVNAGTKAIVEAPAIELGNGATESVMKGDVFSTFWTQVQSSFSTHTHVSSVFGGPTTPPSAPLTSFDSSILSTIVKTK